MNRHGSALPGRARALIAQHVRSIEQLEVLLLLYGNPEQWWSAEGVADELGTSTHSTAGRLEDLASRSLLDVRTAETVLFRYKPVSAAVGEAVRDLARAYAERPAAVAALIYSGPMDEIRAFADAFRIRKAGGAKGGEGG